MPRTRMPRKPAKAGSRPAANKAAARTTRGATPKAKRNTTTSKAATKPKAASKQNAAKPKAAIRPKAAAKPKAATTPKAAAKPRSSRQHAAAKPTNSNRAKAATTPKAAITPASGEHDTHLDLSSGVPTLPQTASSTGAVVHIVDAEDPIATLRAFLDHHAGELTVQQGQIALGAAQLMLLPFARFARDPVDRHGGVHDVADVQALLDLVLSRWGHLPDRAGFHAQEFLRNALAAEASIATDSVSWSR